MRPTPHRAPSSNAPRWACCAALLLLAACGDDASSSGGETDAGATDAGADSAADAGVADVSVEDERPYFESGGFVAENTHVNVLKEMVFEAQPEPGVAPGFDLDGVVSAEGDEASCGHGDVVSPDGTPGIDNNFAALWTPLSDIVGEQVEELLQGSINEGLMLIMFELAEVDDLRNDDDVTFRIYHATNDPELGGADGEIVSSQTYYYDYGLPLSEAQATIEDGVVRVGPMPMAIRALILQLDFVIPLENGYAEFTIDEDGNFSGILGGTIDLDPFFEAIIATPAEAEARFVRPLVNDYADMNLVDGECKGLSVTLGFSGTTGFVVRDPAQE